MQFAIKTVKTECAKTIAKHLALRYGFFDGVPRTLEEIGEEFDLTRERIRQLEKLALCRLRHPSFGIREQDLV